MARPNPDSRTTPRPRAADRRTRGPADRNNGLPAFTRLTLIVNGESCTVAVAAHKTLLEVLREDLGLTGTKHGCELGECGTCTVVVNDLPVLSCLVLAQAVNGARVETIEGMADGPRLHPLQEAFADLGAAQCGYCTPGFLLAAKALLDHNPTPTRQEIKDALAGNLCRCTGYLKIYEAVELAAGKIQHGKTEGRKDGRTVRRKDGREV